MLVPGHSYLLCIYKTQINVQPLIEVQSSMSHLDICPSDLCPFSSSQIGVQFSNLGPFLTQIEIQ